MSVPEWHFCNLCEYGKATSSLAATKVGCGIPFHSYKVKLDDLLPHPTTQSSEETITTAINATSSSALTPLLSSSATTVSGTPLSSLGASRIVQESKPVSLTTLNNTSSYAYTPSFSTSRTSTSSGALFSVWTSGTEPESEQDHPVPEEIEDELTLPKCAKLTPAKSFNNLLRQRLLHNLDSISNREEVGQPEFQQQLIKPAPLDDLYKSVFRPRLMRTVATPTRKTSVLLPRYLRRNPYLKLKSRTPARNTSLQRKEQSTDTGGILKEIQTEVPGIDLSIEGLNHLGHLHRNQVKLLHRGLSGRVRRTSATQKLYEENFFKQVQLAEIEQRNRNEEKRLIETREMCKETLKARGLVRDSKIHSARSKRYFQQYHVQHKRKMSAKKSNEEMLLQGLYEHRLALQREQVHTITRDLRAQEQQESDELQNKIASTNNFYQNEMDMLKESTSRQREQDNARRKAQSLTLEQTRRAIRQQIETEVKTIQERLEQADDFHFQEMNAANLREKWCKRAH